MKEETDWHTIFFQKMGTGALGQSAIDAKVARLCLPHVLLESFRIGHDFAGVENDARLGKSGHD